MKRIVQSTAKLIVNNWKPVTAGILALLGIAASINWKYQKQAKKALKEAPKVIDKATEYTNRIDKIKF